MVEQPAVNRRVTGSSPVSGANQPLVEFQTPTLGFPSTHKERRGAEPTMPLQTRLLHNPRLRCVGPIRILTRHIIPNVLGVVIVYLTLTVPAIILYESFLSFLGLGIQPPMASWGSLIAKGVSQINPIRMYWWLIVFPGVVLVTTLLALNFLGDGLRDAWDVRGN
jgi:hypothetical protein